MKFVNSALHKLGMNYGVSINDVNVEEVVTVLIGAIILFAVMGVS